MNSNQIKFKTQIKLPNEIYVQCAAKFNPALEERNKILEQEDHSQLVQPLH